MFDSHAHLNHERYQADRPQVLARARAAGVRGIVNVGYDPGSSALAVVLAEAEPDLHAAVGLHPHDAEALTGDVLGALRELARRPCVVAVGETGLDFYRNLSAREAQVDAFRRHLELAAELGKTVIVHDRDAHEEVLDTLASHAPSDLRVVLHCFSGDEDVLAEAAARGYWVGIACNVTYPRSEVLRQVAARAPRDRLLLETDCPYLPPQRHRKGGRNEPAYLREALQTVARVRGEDLTALERRTEENAREVFGLTAAGEGAYGEAPGDGDGRAE